MFAVCVTYLTGRVYSAAFDDGDLKSRVEWPPHPSRLLSALVAAWGDSGAEPELRPALEWLESLDPPELRAGDITERKSVQAYVPVNDRGTLPEDRERKVRRLPSATLSVPEVYLVWNTEPSPEVRSALHALLKRASSLGHSATLVSMDIQDNAPTEGLTVWKPAAEGGQLFRVAYPGRLAELEGRFNRFRKDPNKFNRPDRGKTARYEMAGKPQTLVPRTCFDRMIILRRDAGQRASLRSTLSVTAALRGALLSLAPQPVPEFLSGHAPHSTTENPVRSERPHVALVPLPFAGAPHATGDLLGVAALLPSALTPGERQVCWDVFSRIGKLEMSWGWWDINLTDAEESRQNLRPGTWSRPARVWSTITPFVFDRFPKDPYGSEAEEVVRAAIGRVGLPAPGSIDLHYNPWHIGVPKAPLFPPALARAGKPQRYHCHVRLEFAQPVSGPLVAGAGRFYGYGLFRQHAGENVE